MRNLPISLSEQERLKKYEEKPGEKKEPKGIVVKPAYVERNNNGEHNGHVPPKKKKDEYSGGDESKTGLIKDGGANSTMGGKVHPLPSDGAGKLAALSNGNQPIKHHTTSDY